MPSARIIGLLAALLAAGAIAGCGGGSSSNGSAGASTLTTTSSVTPGAGGSSSTPSAATTTSAGATTSANTGSGASASRSAGSAGSSGSGGSPGAKTSEAHGAGGGAGGSAHKKPTPKAVSPTKPRARLAISSAAFPHGGAIPARYTCDGGNVSPPLRWGNVPAGTTQMFVLALSLTAGVQGAIRWAVGGLDPRTGGIPAGSLPPGAVAGRSGDGQVGWAGICPVHGRPQAVIVLVYALRNPLHLASGFDPRTVQSQLAADTLGSGIVYGSYRRP